MFCPHTGKGKGGSEDVFDRLNPTLLNAHLKTLMPGLSAKVFRTTAGSLLEHPQPPSLLGSPLEHSQRPILLACEQARSG